jgi:pyridoxal phosphate enzyme (YggS family)
MLKENLECVKAKIYATARKVGRSPEDITLVCVTKGIDTERIKEIISLGIANIGENRVQEAKEKYTILTQTANRKPLTVRWHMVGHLQTNKVKYAVRLFDLIHSVDSLKLAQEIDKEAKKINKIQEVLIEVNTSGERTKFGIEPEKTLSLAEEILKLRNLRLRGMMTIAAILNNPEKARPYFRTLRELRDKIYQLRVTNYELPILSMGMSQDFEVAIEEGATMVRIGTAIFNPLSANH